ncbi:LOW QUALITY PROTEIN: EF-hand calcium-binding domain-containing protein 4B-like [Amphiura filiformis]|uniref:LOW QUALITY PROTEIN: EF-hand calcium-binding domain-containing protein 4B-like n=1 Tax=Amphiura filiformis TaxID=82378 RepID=UPI003B212D69
MDAKYREKLGLGNKILTDDEIQMIVEEKAKGMFKICDKEEKGFVTKRDMQHLVGELPLTADQLEEVFDLLDDDGNQYMTLEEFNEGFGGYLGVQFKAMQQAMIESEDFEEDELGAENLDHEYSKTMRNLGAEGIFDEQEQTVKELWMNMKKNEPELIGFFEDFVHKASADIIKARNSAGELENALRTRTMAHETEVHRLYEEMETQIKSERERILHEERDRERIKEDLSTQVKSKEEQLQELMKRQTELEEKLGDLTVAEQEAREAREELEKDNYELRSELDNSKYDLKESKGYLSEVQGKIKKEKRERAQVAFKVTAGIVQERESLVKQLEMLRDMNKKLQDERDEYLSQQTDNQDTSNLDTTHDTKGKEEAEAEALAHIARQGSIMSGYSDPSSSNGNINRSKSPVKFTISKLEVDEALSRRRRGMGTNSSQASVSTDGGDGSLAGLNGLEEDDDDIEVDDTYLLNQGLFPGRNESSLCDELGGGQTKLGAGDEEVDGLEGTQGLGFSALSMRGEPVGAHTTESMSDAQRVVATNNVPERLFKVVFVGDSGVGKTSFIHRFCTDSFQGNFSATIGVDFQVKSMSVNDQLVALQLWDTAGQERFRSITRHYFRKADGVIVMYDVTSEQSFVNVRNWMSSVEEATEENVVRLIIGNKKDLVQEDPTSRVIKEEVGKSLAETYNSLFIETSAKSGENVKQAFIDMAKLLWEKEDQDIEKALTLDDAAIKKGCCS